MYAFKSWLKPKKAQEGSCLLIFLSFLFRDYMNQLCLRLETNHRVKTGNPLLSSGCDEIIFTREFAQSGHKLLKSFLRVEFIKRWMRFGYRPRCSLCRELLNKCAVIQPMASK